MVANMLSSLYIFIRLVSDNIVRNTKNRLSADKIKESGPRKEPADGVEQALHPAPLSALARRQLGTRRGYELRTRRRHTLGRPNMLNSR